MNELTSIEICAGAGGQALGLEQAGFDHLALVEIDPWACETLRHNRPEWNVVGPVPTRPAIVGEGKPGDLRVFDASSFAGEVALLAGGVPCPPFSKAGKQLGSADSRDMFPEAIRLIAECQPRSVMLENVRGLLDPKFSDYRNWIETQLDGLGYRSEWRLLHASSFGVPQLRPRAILVGLRDGLDNQFSWPEPNNLDPISVGEALRHQMSSNGWEGAAEWADRADRIAPTLVGGSKKHGGPDLGPTRAKKAWAALGVDGMGLANDVPARDFDGVPRLTVPMAAVIQGFPTTWEFMGPKTHAYRQVGNAFPPPVAAAVGSSIARALSSAKIHAAPMAA